MNTSIQNVLKSIMSAFESGDIPDARFGLYTGLVIIVALIGYFFLTPTLKVIVIARELKI